MDFLLDSANLDDIKKYSEIIPLAGVTSNPSIIKKEGKIDFFAHMKKVRSIIGPERSLHIQVVGQNFEAMMRDAEAILDHIDQSVYIKVPVNSEGLKTIQVLKRHGIHTTATAIYTEFQAYLAVAAGADYIAPYFNRMENLNIDPCETIAAIAQEIEKTKSTTKILGASFKNVGQVTAACKCGAQAVTITPDIIDHALSMPSIKKAVDDFTSDWESVFGVGTKISDLVPVS